MGNPKQICGQLVGRTINLRKREIEQKINNNDSSKSENEYEINQLINNIFQFKDYEWYYAVNDGLAQADDPCIMVLSGHSNTVTSVCYSPDGKTLASGSDDETVRIWDVMSGGCVHVLNGHSSNVNSVCYSPDGKTLASGSKDKTVRIWDVLSGECVSTDSTLPFSFRTASTSLPYDGSRDLCVDVFSCEEVSVTHSSATFYNNTVLVHR